jgi:decaprenylphospho-beta-D-erythro-pentofuranosid-2-ulose 2-reductase
MKNVFLFGGTSEIGKGIIQRLMEPDSGFQVKNTYFISRNEEIESSTFGEFVGWAPKVAEDVEAVVNQLPIAAGDIAIIAVGSISLPRWESDPTSLAPQRIESEVFVNAILPIAVLIRTANAMVRAGGGKIVVLSSVSAFPPLSAHLFYGTSKNLLDRFSQKAGKALAKHGVQIVIVRPGFVKTKLHEERKFSFLPTNIPEIANSVARALASENPRIIWLPRMWSLVSQILVLIPGVARLANRALLKSL